MPNPGHKFAGWREGTSQHSTNTTYTFTVTRDIVLEACFVPCYTVTFNANGGTGTMAPITDAYGYFTLPECGFTPPAGKQFKGWALTSNATEVYANTDFSTRPFISSNTTIYAIWEDEGAVATQKITEIRLGELPKISTSTNVSELRTAIRNDFASKTGLASLSTTYPYIFFSGSGHQTSFSSFEEGKTYYAYWVINAAEGYELSDSISIYVGSNKLNKINSGALYTGYQAGTNSNTGKKTIWVMVEL